MMEELKGISLSIPLRSLRLCGSKPFCKKILRKEVKK